MGLIGALVGLAVAIIYLVLKAIIRRGNQAIKQKSGTDTAVPTQRQKQSIPLVDKNYTKTRIFLVIAILMIVLPVFVLFLYFTFR